MTTMPIIYLDHAAKTPINSEVLAAMLPYFESKYQNASSLHHSGRSAAAVLRSARQRISACLEVHEDEVVYTGSGTEANNLAIRGAAHAATRHTEGRHLIISSIEHPSVLESAKQLVAEGWSVSFVPVDHDGLVSADAVRVLIRPDTVLVSVMYVNNEIGTIEPIESIARVVRSVRRGNGYPLFHTDACQAAGVLPLKPKLLGVDLMTINGSKIYGPCGVGALYVRRGVPCAPIIVGGSQEYGLRSGTESVALIVGLSVALERAQANADSERSRLTSLRETFVQKLRTGVRGIKINGHPTLVAPHIVHVTIPAVEGESLLLLLDEAGIEVATGSACSSHNLMPSHVLVALGVSEQDIHGSIRFSFGKSTTRSDLDTVLKVLPPLVGWLTKLSAITTHTYATYNTSM